MPCWSRETSTVEWGANTDPKLLAAAMKDLGYTVTIARDSKTFRFYSEEGQVSGSFADNRFTITSGSTVDEKVFKRAYSAQVVKSAAQRFGWQVKQPSENKFQVTRRV